jgi:hypothetical protein
MKVVTKYILPAALVAGFLFYFFTDAFNRHVSLDDYFYEGLVRKHGAAGAIRIFYDIANGRWFSHIICGMCFTYIGTGFFGYGIHLTILLLLFVLATAALYKNYYATFLKKDISLISLLPLSFVFAATLYFMLFEGRWETWGWVSSANTHLLSVIVSLFLFSILIKKNTTTVSALLIFLLSAMLGGLNEVNAICAALTAGGLLFLNKYSFPDIKLNKVNIAVSILAIAASLAINIFSGGYKLRMEGLPDFTITQSLKNTAHSFLMPVLHYHYLSFYAAALIVFILFIKETNISFQKNAVLTSVFVLAVAGFSFFLHCYTLSDVVPARGAIWSYCLVLFVFSLPFLSPKENPEI